MKPYKAVKNCLPYQVAAKNKTATTETINKFCLLFYKLANLFYSQYSYLRVQIYTFSKNFKLFVFDLL